jgi:hypothetical protein
MNSKALAMLLKSFGVNAEELKAEAMKVGKQAIDLLQNIDNKLLDIQTRLTALEKTVGELQVIEE